ncbi:MAG: hypothetical protein HY400_06840 [Elusimicrobia bacterium]|nr:hypothetical protein [Elusimicrobiota bacterium]
MAPNINDFRLFADGGWDGNWYVGFNNCWIVELPPVPRGRYYKAFIGAKLGRAKTEPKPSKPWERAVVIGKIYMAISPSASFSSDQSSFLISTQDISLEPQPGITMPGLGESQWFWTEVPVTRVSFDKPNYLALWSKTNYFTSASSSPIVAGYESKTKEVHAWLNRSVRGVPPRRMEGSLETPIMYLHPALALKLIPINQASVTVSPLETTNVSGAVLLQFSVLGENVESAWLELSHDQFTWERITPFLRHPPYHFTLSSNMLPKDGAFLRGAAKDSLENIGHGPESQIVPPSN